MISAKHDGSEQRPVRESGKIVAAFGRNGGSAASRIAARPIVAEVQNEGRWFFCGCREHAVLVPVDGTFVRRKTKKSAEHHDDCPFAVEPTEQALIVKSLRPHSPEVPFRLLADRDVATETARVETSKQTYNTPRPGLAKLLISLAESSTIQRRAQTAASLGEQFKSLRDQAGKFLLDTRVPVRRMLCADTVRYDDFVRDFDEKARMAGFTNRVRPHGILLDKIKGVKDGNLICMDDKVIPVVGKISIFGRADAPVNPWSTYIVAGLIGRLGGETEPRLLRVYIHPCVSTRNLMLVDSNYERGTLKIIEKLQREFGCAMKFNVRKPLTDIGRREIDENLSDQQRSVDVDRNGAPKILIPDFILEFPQIENGRGDIIVETFGFPWPSYRDDKEITVPAMRRALGGIGLAIHDFCVPEESSQAGRDEKFEKALRDMLNDRLKWLNRRL